MDLKEFKKEYPGIASALQAEGRAQAGGGANDVDADDVRAEAEREWKADAAVRQEFVTLESYRAYRVAAAKGLVRTLGAGANRSRSY